MRFIKVMYYNESYFFVSELPVCVAEQINSCVDLHYNVYRNILLSFEREKGNV